MKTATAKYDGLFQYFYCAVKTYVKRNPISGTSQ